jgi:phospholipid transport system substrate-binding protein
MILPTKLRLLHPEPRTFTGFPQRVVPMNLSLIRRALVLPVLLVAMATAGAQNNPALTPNQLVQQTADRLAAQIDGRGDYLSANPKELYALVDTVFLPVFDTRYAGRLVMGRHWTGATAAQRQEFIDAFYTFLLRSYSRYVVRFEKDKVKVLPPVPQAAPDKAVVKTQMTLKDGKLIPVHYSLYQTPTGWRAYDVRIEGISYVTNYRNQFNQEIGARGLPAVIARLRADAAKLEKDQPAKGKAAGQ